MDIICGYKKLTITNMVFGGPLGQKSFLGTLGLKVKYLDWGVRIRGPMYHFLLVTYHSIVNKNKIRGQFLGFYCDFSKNDLFCDYTEMTKGYLKNQRSQNQV